MASRTPSLRRDQIAEMQAKADEAADLLKALANGQRLRVLCLLTGGERSVGEINAEVDLSQSALSQHLALLRAQGLVHTRKEAQTVYYALADGPVRELIGVLHRSFCESRDQAGARPRRSA